MRGDVGENNQNPLILDGREITNVVAKRLFKDTYSMRG